MERSENWRMMKDIESRVLSNHHQNSHMFVSTMKGC